MPLTNAAESNRVSLRYIPEVTWGTTPASGLTKEMRITSSSLVAGKETQISEELRADRMVPSVIEVGAMSSGEVNQEFSAGSSDDFFQAFLLGTWTRAMNFFQVKGSSVSITDNNTVRISGADWSSWLSVGQWLKLEGFLILGNNRYVQISAVNFTGGNTVIDVNGTFLAAEAGSAFTRILDAGDVISVATTTTLDASNVINLPAGALAGLTFYQGQRIYVEGLGKATGDIVVGATDPTEGATITINDGVDTVVFEVRTNASLVTSGRVHVALSGTPATQATNIASAVNDQFRRRNFKVSVVAATDTVTFTNHGEANGSIATSDATAFTVTSFSGYTANKRGIFTVASADISSANITVNETLGTDANSGGLTIVVKGSHVRNPGALNQITKQSFTIETGFTDINQYLVMRGMRVGSFTMNVSSGEIVNTTFSFMGSVTETPVGTSKLGNSPYTPVATTATEIFNATANVGNVVKNGAALSTAIMSIELTGEASLREQRAVGAKYPEGIGYGRFQLTGTITAYFANVTDFYNAFIDHETFSVGWSFTDADSNTYYFTIPALKVTSDPIAPEGIDQDIMEAMEFVAQRDPVLNTQFMIDRFSSLWPSSAA